MNYLVVQFLFKHRRLDQIVEGKSTTLIEEGKVLQKNLAKELLSHSELLTVLHRQGFDDVDEVDQCVLEPSGTFAVKRKCRRKMTFNTRSSSGGWNTSIPACRRWLGGKSV